MIDFEALVTQQWDTATVRKKLDRILLIFYAWHPLHPIARFQTLAAGIWSPDATTWRTIRSDWESIRDLVAQGRRSEVSESLTSVLGAATKGPGHGSTSRAWSLKQPFVTWIYRSMAGKVATTFMGGVSRDPAAEFEALVLSRLGEHVGRSFDVLASVAGREGMGGKAAVAAIARALAGEKPSGRHGDFQRFGIEVKIVPVSASGRLVEAMSFPAFVHEELIFESWEESDLLGRLNRLLIIPVHRERKASVAEVRLGQPFFWSPAEPELQGIKREWERFRSLIERGRARDLPKASETMYIHVRPKGRDSRDRDQAPGGVDVIKKCFWLNQPYLERVLAGHGALDPPPRR
jgi:DNA mismatch repair endonuclease MutH